MPIAKKYKKKKRVEKALKDEENRLREIEEEKKKEKLN